MRRIVLQQTPTGTTHVLDATAAHYVTHVLRLAAGALVEATDARGLLVRGVLEWPGGVATLSAIEAVRTESAVAECVVVAALVKQNRWEALLEKACELGATRIIPLEAERCVVKVEGRSEAKVERWQRICDETAKQCLRLDVPRVEPPVRLGAALERVWGCTLLQFDEKSRLAAWSTAPVEGPIALFTGPEGGLSEPEKEQLRRQGALTLGLGRHLLRAETAVTAALAAVRMRRDGLL